MNEELAKQMHVLVLWPGVKPKYVKSKEEEESFARVDEFRKTLPSFDFGEPLLYDKSVKRIKRPPVELHDGIIYEGEWDDKGLRDGRAI